MQLEANPMLMRSQPRCNQGQQAPDEYQERSRDEKGPPGQYKCRAEDTVHKEIALSAFSREKQDSGCIAAHSPHDAKGLYNKSGRRRVAAHYYRSPCEQCDADYILCDFEIADVAARGERTVAHAEHIDKDQQHLESDRCRHTERMIVLGQSLRTGNDPRD